MKKGYSIESPSLSDLSDESPADNYNRQRQNYRSCVNQCNEIFKKLQNKDEYIKQHQNELYSLLVEADKAYEKMEGSKDNPEKKKKCTSVMQKVLADLKLNLSEQDTALKQIEKDIEQASLKIQDFAKLMQDTRNEHKALSAALEHKIRELKKEHRLGDENETRRHNSPKTRPKSR